MERGHEPRLPAPLGTPNEGGDGTDVSYSAESGGEWGVMGFVAFVNRLPPMIGCNRENDLVRTNTFHDWL